MSTEIAIYRDEGAWVHDVQRTCEELTGKGWELADKILAGLDLFGTSREKVSELYDTLMEHTGLARQTLLNLAHTARKFPPGQRNERLTISHHVALLGVEEERADYILSEAEANGYSARRTRAEAHGAVGGAPTKSYGKCRICGRPLTDPTQVAKGCGPVCEAKLKQAAGGEDREEEDAMVNQVWEMVEEGEIIFNEQGVNIEVSLHGERIKVVTPTGSWRFRLPPNYRFFELKEG